MDDKLQEYLYRCADKIDATLRKNSVVGVVTGGCITGCTLRFDIAVQTNVKTQQIVAIRFWRNVQRVYRNDEYICIEMSYEAA